MAWEIDITKIFLITLLFQCDFSTKAPIYSTMLSIMNASKGSYARPVLLYSLTDTESLFESLNDLPIPIRFVPASEANLYEELYRRKSRYHGTRSDASIEVEFSLEYRLIFSLNSWHKLSDSTKKKWKELAYKRPKNLIFVPTESHTEGLRDFHAAICNAVTVTVTDISAPEDRYRLCASRKTVQASWLFKEERSEGNFPKGRMFRAIMKPHGGGRRATLTSEQLALIDAYRSLNNTVEETRIGGMIPLLTKDVDLYIPPVRGSLFLLPGIFGDANYAPAPLCFFSAMAINSEITFIDSWVSLMALVTSLIIYSVILATYVNIRSRLCSRRQMRKSKSSLLLFVVSTFLGRPPAPSLADSPTFRGLAFAVWTLGMMVLGNYVQSSITAIRSAPVAVKVVDSYPELSRVIRNRILTPCLDEHWYGTIMFSFDPQTDAFHKDILDKGAVYQNNLLATPDLPECYRRTQAGTHVALSVCSDDEVAAASQFDLVPGDHYFTSVQVSAIHVTNPLRYQHRRLLLAVAEAGLAKPYRRPMEPRYMPEENTSLQVPIYFFCFMFGCAVSFLALAFEVLIQTELAKAMGRRITRFVCQRAGKVR